MTRPSSSIHSQIDDSDHISVSARELLEHRRFFRAITDRRIREDDFTNVPELELAIDLYVSQHNIEPEPFISTVSASNILARVMRAKATLAATSQ